MNALLRLLGKTVLVCAVVGLIGAIFIYSGVYNVTAMTGHSRPVTWILRTAMTRSVTTHARQVAPAPNFNPQDRELAGKAAGHYEQMCRTCHGAPGKKADPWQLHPPAPNLADASRAMAWTDAEVFWIIKNGIKDTGMSAFGGSHGDEDLWALTALVRQLPTFPADQYETMAAHAIEERTDHETTERAEPAHAHDH